MIRFTSGLLVALLAVASSASALDFSHSHTQDEIDSYLKEVAADNSDFVKIETLGVSEQGRELNYLVLSKAADPATAPSIYLNGTHHGDEWSATETTLGVIQRLTAAKPDAEADALLHRFVIVIQPLVNADGHAARTREDPEGRDPNRDYSYPLRSDAKSFAIPFIELVKELNDKYKFTAALAYHSGEQSVLWPWCYTSKASKDEDTFYTLAKLTAKSMSFSQYLQSYDDYATDGEYIDYVYWKYNTLALTMEVSDVKSPSNSAIAAVVDRAVKGSFAFMEGVASSLDGTLAIEKAPTHSLAEIEARRAWRAARGPRRE